MSEAEVWERDLNAEGIEPHPGPRYISKNINSLLKTGELYKILDHIVHESAREKITAVFIQDHRLPPQYHETALRIAHNKNLLIIIAYAPPRPTCPRHTCYGGTMIIIPHTAI